jgi:hypothetical protein
MADFSAFAGREYPEPLDAYRALVADPANVRGLAAMAAQALAPNLMSLMAGEAARPIPDMPAMPGKIPSADDPRYGMAAAELADFAGMFAGPGGPAKAAGTIGAGIAAKAARRSRRLPMDEASVAARMEEMGYSPQAFWRGERSGTLPNEYPAGAYYSRDKDYATGFARMGGRPEPREFRLDLSRAWDDRTPLTAEQYSRVVNAADPPLARELIEMIAPGKSAEWFAEYARRNPDSAVVAGGSTALIRHAIEKNAKDPDKVFLDAGFTALDSGRDVRTLTGFGQRLASAKFDPRKAHLRDISAALAVAPLGASAFLPESQ